MEAFNRESPGSTTAPYNHGWTSGFSPQRMPDGCLSSPLLRDRLLSLARLPQCARPLRQAAPIDKAVSKQAMSGPAGMRWANQPASGYVWRVVRRWRIPLKASIASRPFNIEPDTTVYAARHDGLEAHLRARSFSLMWIGSLKLRPDNPRSARDIATRSKPPLFQESLRAGGELR